MSAKSAVRRKPPAARRAPVQSREPDPFETDPDGDKDDPDEDPAITNARARKAKVKLAQGVRVAVKNAPNRGFRPTRSDFGRDAAVRGERTERAPEFSEEEIRQFMQDDEQQLPRVPDTKDWHYKWMRCRLADKDDGSNSVAHLNGRMQYEVVTGPDMLPKGTDLKALKISHADYGGAYQYRDCLLVRCPKRLEKLANIASLRRAEKLNEMLDAGAQAAGIPGERRTGIVVEENYERSGIREPEIGSDEEAA